MSDKKRLSMDRSIICILASNASFKITFFFRLGNWLLELGGVAKFLLFLVQVIHKHHQFKTGIQLSIGTSIGPGLLFSHFSCIVINGNCHIGKNCTIMQGVTIGGIRGSKGGVPSIGNNVLICSHAQVLGNIKIGNNVVIGAGAIVLSDLPDNAVAVGNPARIINYNAKQHLTYYLTPDLLN